MTDNTEEGSRAEKAEEGVRTRADDPSIPAVDGGWGWVVVIGSFVQEFFTAAVMRCFTLVYVELMNRFRQSDTAVSAAMTIFATSYFSSMFVVGSLANRYSARSLSFIGCVLFGGGHILMSFAPNLYTIYITYFCIGVASAFRTTPAQVLVNKYFQEKRSRAFSLANLGRGIASFAMPPVMAACFSEYAWRGGMLVISAISLHVFIGPAAFRPLEDNYPRYRIKEMEEMSKISKAGFNEGATETDRLVERSERGFGSKVKSLFQVRKKDSNSSDRLLHVELLKDSWYMCFMLSLFFFNISILSTIFLAPLGKENSYSHSQITLLVSLFGASDLIGSIILGLVLDHHYLQSRLYHVCYVMYILTGISSIAMGLVKSYVLMAVSVVCRGLTVSIYSVRMPVMSYVVGAERLASGISLSAPALALGNFLSPLIGGILKDRLQSYAPVMYFAGVCVVLAGLIMCVSHFVHIILNIHPQYKTDCE